MENCRYCSCGRPKSRTSPCFLEYQFLDFICGYFLIDGFHRFFNVMQLLLGCHFLHYTIQFSRSSLFNRHGVLYISFFLLFARFNDLTVRIFRRSLGPILHRVWVSQLYELLLGQKTLLKNSALHYLYRFCYFVGPRGGVHCVHSPTLNKRLTQTKAFQWITRFMHLKGFLGILCAFSTQRLPPRQEAGLRCSESISRIGGICWDLIMTDLLEIDEALRHILPIGKERSRTASHWKFRRY